MDSTRFGGDDGEHAARDPATAPLSAPRRHVLTGMAALAAGMLLPGGAGLAQGPAKAPAKPHRIDVHHHLAPPGWLAAQSGAQPAWNGWTPAKSMEDMDRAGVATSMLSLTTPGVGLGDTEAQRRLARECNEYGAKLVADHHGRFGLFAVLPIPDMDGSLKELEYALDTLKADGVVLYTSYNDKWLGDPAFAPVMEELNRRKVVVYTHPTTANCCRNLVPDQPPALIEFGTDTSRAIARMLFSGSAVRYPDIRMIWSHAGGTMPFLIERFLFQGRNPQAAKQVPDGVVAQVRKFYYDTAQSTEAGPMLALKKIIPVSQIVFGTDFPYRTAEEGVTGLKKSGVFTAKELRAIERENAMRLLPRYGVQG